MLTEQSRLKDFPSLKGRTYLNTAAEGIPSNAVHDAFERYWTDKLAGMSGRDNHFATLESAKKRLASIYGLSTDEVSFCSCSSEAYNLLATAITLNAGDEIIINDLDFPAGTTPWLESDSPAVVRVWRSRNGALRIDDLYELLSGKTRMVVTSLVSFYNGYMIPLRQVVDAIRKSSHALLALDVTQAVGRVPLDLTGVDVVISSTHKWILASHGGGMIGIPKHSADRIRVRSGGWFNRDDAFGATRFEKSHALPGAAGFAVGMPNFPAIYAIDAALGYLEGIGIEKIRAAADPLVTHCLAELKKLPVEVITPDSRENLAGIIAFKHPESERLNAKLLQQNIHVMSQAGRMRVAIHGYNTAGEIEQFLAGMKEALKHV